MSAVFCHADDFSHRPNDVCISMFMSGSGQDRKKANDIRVSLSCSFETLQL